MAGKIQQQRGCYGQAWGIGLFVPADRGVDFAAALGISRLWRRMNFFQLKLAPRLFLASLPVFVGPWLYRLMEQLFPSTEFTIGFLWYLWTPPFHDVLFGLLVLAPFIAAPNARAIRVLALLVATVAIYTCAVSAVGNTQGALDPWLERDDLRFISVVPIAMMATWLLAAATAWIAPLGVSRRYWIYTGLAGLATGLGFLISQNSQAVQQRPEPRPV